MVICHHRMACGLMCALPIVNFWRSRPRRRLAGQGVRQMGAEVAGVVAGAAIESGCRHKRSWGRFLTSMALSINSR